MRNVRIAFYALFVCLFVTNTQALGQYTEQYRTYQDSSIYLQFPLLSPTKFVVNGQYKNIGFMGRKIKDYLQVSPYAAVEFKQYRTKRIASSALTVVSIGLYFLAFDLENDRLNPNLLGISAIGITTAGFLRIASFNDLNHAIAIYNQDLLR
ncbi:MAG: hypothetical protein AAF847_07235 [Bacteroidota bacterium]